MKEVKRIVVVGGGTAGWITASWFSRRWGKLIDVTVIDKYEPERVGVGEATLLSFPGVMQKMGFKVEDWMNRIDATFKAGILFPGWGREDNVIWHPFGFTSIGDKKVPMYDIWTNYQDKYDIKDISPLYRTAMENKIELNLRHWGGVMGCFGFCIYAIYHRIALCRGFLKCQRSPKSVERFKS